MTARETAGELTLADRLVAEAASNRTLRQAVGYAWDHVIHELGPTRRQAWREARRRLTVMLGAQQVAS